MSAHAAGCGSTGQVSAATGTGAGSLAQTLATYCTEVPTKFNGSTVSLDGSVSIPASSVVSLYLDVNGAPVTYTFGATGGSTYSLTGPASQPIYFDQNASSSTPAYAKLILAPNFQATVQTLPTVSAGVELELGSPNNVTVQGSGGSGIVLSDALPVGSLFPILGFTADMNYTQNAIIVVDAGGLDLGGHSVGISSTIYGVYGTDSLVVSGGGNLTMAGDFATLGSLTVAPGTTMTQLTDTLNAAAQLVVDGTLDVAGIAGGVVHTHTLEGSDPSAMVHLGANTLSIANASGYFAGGIDGSGGVNVLTGTQELDGAASYTGTTNVAAGATLKLVGIGSIANSTLVDNGVFDLSGSTVPGTVYSLGGSGNVLLGGQMLTVSQASGNLSGTISGPGGLEVAAGTQILSAANTYSGPTKIDRGAVLALSGSGSTASSAMQDNGLLSVSGASQPVSVPSLSGSGQVDLGSVDLNLTQASGTFNGSVTGQGALKLLGGQEALGGNIATTGPVVVQGGALALEDGATLASALQVQAAAQTVVQGRVQAGGDVAVSGQLGVGTPANPGAILTVNGSYTQGSTATLTEQVTPTAASRLQVNGPALNLGGQLVVQATPGLYVNKTFVLVDAPASTKLNGSFGTWQVSGLSPANYAMRLIYQADPQVLLNVSSIDPFSVGAHTPNQRQVAGVLDNAVYSADPALSALLTSLLNASPSLSRTLESINGQLYSATPQWLLQATQQQWDSLFDRLDLGPQAGPARPEQAFAYVSGQRGGTFDDGNAEGVDSSSSALTLGRQIRRGAWQLGAAFGTLSIGATRHVIGDGMTAWMYRAGVFAGRRMGAFRLGSVLGLTQGQISYAGAQRNARVLSWQTRVAHDFALPRGNLLTPILSLGLQSLKLGGATDADNGLGLVVPGSSRTSASSLAALRLLHPWKQARLGGTFSAALGMRHWWRRPASSLPLSFAAVPGLSFSDWSVAPPRNALEADLGFSAYLRRNLNVQLAYQGELGRQFRSNQLQLRLGWRF